MGSVSLSGSKPACGETATINQYGKGGSWDRGRLCPHSSPGHICRQMGIPPGETPRIGQLDSTCEAAMSGSCPTMCCRSQP